MDWLLHCCKCSNCFRDEQPNVYRRSKRSVTRRFFARIASKTLANRHLYRSNSGDEAGWTQTVTIIWALESKSPKPVSPFISIPGGDGPRTGECAIFSRAWSSTLAAARSRSFAKGVVSSITPLATWGTSLIPKCTSHLADQGAGFLYRSETSI